MQLESSRLLVKEQGIRVITGNRIKRSIKIKSITDLMSTEILINSLNNKIEIYTFKLV